MKGIPLRRRLLLLTAAAIAPVAVMAGVGLLALARQQAVQAEHVALELSRSVANAVDAELRLSISVLDALGGSLTLDQNDLAGFAERARRVIAQRTAWAAILLADSGRTPVFDTRAGEAGALPAVADTPSFDRVIATRSPVVGGLTKHGDGWLFPVRVPVMRNGELRYVLTALVKPEAIRDVLTRQQVPIDWVISIVDASGLRVARSRAHDENLGGRLSESVQDVIQGGGDEGFGVSYALEGERIFTPYTRLPDSGWFAVLGIPTALVDAAAAESMAVYGGGALVSILLGILGALWVARSIARPIADLGEAAEAVGRREPPRPPATAIREIAAVGDALKKASEEIARGEAQREELLQKERQAREAAEAADRAKEAFMAVLSHELRTPLNAVYGWARMLQSGQIRDEALAARARDAIVRNADVQVRLIDDLLDFSRIASGKLRLDIRSLDMRDVVHEALDAVRPAVVAKGISVTPLLSAERCLVQGDPARLQQVVWNLLMNAVKFTPNGGQIEIQLRCRESQAELSVTDTGEGIPPQILPHVFERFWQRDSSSTRVHRGLGLGLALARHLIELHGGHVVAESDGAGRGSTFRVTIPIARHAARPTDVEEPPAPPLAVASRTEVVRLDGLRVLVAEDDREAAVLTETILKGAGAEVRACASAADTLETFLAWHPDVLVSDIEMPGEDGYSLIQKVRALPHGEGGETPAIALSAYGRPQDRLRALTAGFSMHVPKPVDPGELTAIVAGLAGRQEQAS